MFTTNTEIEETILDNEQEKIKLFNWEIDTRIIAGTILIIGIAIGGTIYQNQIQPQLAEQDKLIQEINSKEKIVQEAAGLQKEIDLATIAEGKANTNRKKIISLYGTNEDLNTLLVDLNKEVKTRNGNLLRYNPGDTEDPKPVMDGSLGTKSPVVKVKNYELEVDGKFNNVLSIIRSIERSQRLIQISQLKIQGVEKAPEPKPTTNKAPEPKPTTNKTPEPKSNTEIKSTFTISVIIPLSEKEITDIQAQSQTPPTNTEKK